MSKYFIPDSAFGQEAECPICSCLWTDPVEIKGCEHILCRECVQQLQTCPTCNHPITKLNTPNHAILRMLMRVRGRCSSCEWKGVYKEFKENHSECLTSGAGADPSARKPSVPASSAGKEEEQMQDYYMEDELPAQVDPRVLCPRGQAPPYGHPPTPAAAAVPPYTVPDLEGSVLRSGTRASVAQALSADEARRWRRGLTAKARDYGLDESDFASLTERFTSFATRSSEGRPVLRWRGACRLLRYFNYPNHPDDVRNLFETAQQSPSNGGVDYHALCLWIAINQRNPQQWYGMNAVDYMRILRIAQVLDEEKKGLFTLDQAALLAEQYFQRELPPAEWADIGKVLREKDETIRQYFMNAGNYSALNRDFNPMLGDVKLPFHDILVTFRAHVETLKRRQRAAATNTRQQQCAQRIRRMIQHYEPAAVGTIDTTIAKFVGEEEDLLQTLIAMYGPEP